MFNSEREGGFNMGSLVGFQRRTPARATQAVITPAGAGTELEQSLAELGGAAVGVGVGLGLLQRQRNDELAHSDFVRMQAATDVGFNEYIRSLKTIDPETGYNEINKGWADKSKKLYAEIAKTTKQRRAQQAYTNFIELEKVKMDKDIDNIAWAVSVERNKTKLFNSSVDKLNVHPNYDEGLIEVGMDIEDSGLLTAEEKDLTLANVIIETNPQKYLDMVDAEGTKELFELLSHDQKQRLEVQANGEISRIRREQERELKLLQSETWKTMSVLKREGNLDARVLDANRANLSADIYARFNNTVEGIAEQEKKDRASLAKVKDFTNRRILGDLQAATNIDELDILQRKVDDLASFEQRKISVAKAKEWTSDIDAKKTVIIENQANGFDEYVRLSDRLTAAMAGRVDLETVSLEIDNAITPRPGKDATITQDLADKLDARVERIRANPGGSKRPSVVRAHATFADLRNLQISVVKSGEPVVRLAGQAGLPEAEGIQQAVIAISNSFDAILVEFDEYVNTIAGERNFDELVLKKVQQMTRPAAERVTLGFLKKLFTPKQGFLKSVRPEELALAAKKLKAFKKLPVWKTLSDIERKEAKQAFDNEFTIEDVLVELGL